MRLLPGLVLATAASLGMTTVASSAAPTERRDTVPATPEIQAVPSKRQQRRWTGVLPDYRAKGPRAKPRKRANRLHISKRTRRKHRRAAKGN